MNELFTNFGYEVTLFFNGFPDRVSNFFNIFRYLGREEFFILILPLIFWCINKSLGKRLIIITTLSSFIGYFLKDIFTIPRSAPGSGVVNRIGEVSDYLFPSTHLLTTGSFWGLLSLNTKLKLSKIICYLIVLGALISRLIHGVQTPLSLILTLVIGALIVFLFNLLQGKIADAYNTQYTLLQRILVVFIVTLGLIILNYLFNTRNFNNALISISLFTGGVSGIILEKDRLGFKVEGNLEIRLLRYIIGVIVISFIYILANLILEMTNGSSIAIFIKYLLLSFSGTFIIPLIFIRMKLAKN